MKKVLVAMAVMLATMMISCSNGDVLESVNEKIEKDGIETTFTQEEYKAIISYMIEYTEAETESGDVESAQMQYPRWDDYDMILFLAVREALLDNSTMAEYDKLEKIKRELADKHMQEIFNQEQEPIIIEEL